MDEGHRLKNSASKISQRLGTFKSQFRLLLTGTVSLTLLSSQPFIITTVGWCARSRTVCSHTWRRAQPLNNNLTELFNLMTFLELSEFHQYHQDITLETMTEERVEQMRKSLRPHMLRRLKTEVFKDMPKKKEVLVPATLTRLQKEYYRAIYTKNYDLLRSVGSVSRLL